MRGCSFLIVLWLASFGLATASAGGESESGSSLLSQDSSSALFGADKLWRWHLIISAENWRAMLPRRGLQFFGGPEFSRDDATAGEPRATEEPPTPATRRGGFKFDFAYVRGRLETDTGASHEVGVRFKGNSSYAMVGRTLKRPFKIDFDRYQEEQRFHGLKMLNLVNNAFEPTQLRESLSYHVFRAAGVPAPRTAFVDLSLTISGQRERESVGLYTLVEQVDSTFLKRHFGHGRGMLLKPEGLLGLPYLGSDWSVYPEYYRPKSPPTERQQQRLIEFTRLVNFSGDEEFARAIDQRLDVDLFLRYLACCSAMVNLDSFLGFNHNYFLYLNPEDERFVMIPWDLNGSFAGMTMSGSPERQANWSIATPYIWHNRLVERLLVIPAYDALYRQRLRELLDQAFQADRLSASIDAMQALIEPVVARERAASKPELPAGLALLIALGGQPTELKPFIEQRSRSVRRQLEGEIRGNELILGLGMPTERDTLAKQLARPLLKAVDQNQDGQLSVDEIAAGLAELERRSTAPAAEGTPVLNEEALAKQIANIFPKRSGMFQWLGGGRAPSRAGFGPGPLLAGYLLYGLGHDVYAQPREHLAELAPALLVRADANEDQLVDQRELARLLNWLPPVPQHFGVDVQAAQPEKSTGRTPASE